MAKEKQNLLLVTFKKMNKARFECYLLTYRDHAAKKLLCNKCDELLCKTNGIYI